MRKNSLCLLILPLLAACVPTSSDDNGQIIGYSEYVKNFGNNAAACFSPKIIGDAIECRTVARFAHYTMAYLQVEPVETGYIKTLYKLRFNEKNGLGCLDHSNIDGEKIRIYTSNNFDAQISDNDIEIRDPQTLETAKQKILAREKPLGEACYHYRLFLTKEAKMPYQFAVEEFKSGAPTGKSENMAIFSNGTNLRFSRQ